MYGRFNSPDPYAGSAGPSNPGSWNRYSYTLGDPVDRNDRKGLDSEDCGAAWVSDASLSGPCTVDGYASIDLSAVMQSACNQLIMAFGPVPVTDLSCAGYAPIIPVAAPARPVTETCGGTARVLEGNPKHYWPAGRILRNDRWEHPGYSGGSRYYP